MDQTLVLLLGTAGTVALLHTLIGVDHAIPFIVIGRARGWSWRRLWVVTAVAGVVHVLSSVVLGLLAVGAGVALDSVMKLETGRGVLASWLLVGFGVAYASWGLWRALRDRRHSHAHAHPDGVVHDHEHGHRGEHVHLHAREGIPVTTWTLFLVFAFGPCEALIPLMTAGAATGSAAAVAAVAALFGTITVATMLLMVTLGYAGLRLAPLRFAERYVHTLAGVAIAASGAAIQLLGI